jgi:hypothetical protein
VVCKRECFDVCGLFHEPLRRAQDWDMWIRIARRFSFVHIPAVLTEYTWEPFNGERASRSTIDDLQSVVDRALQADRDLGPGTRRRILGRLAYTQGVEHLRYGRRQEARACFRESFRSEPWFGRSILYWAVAAMGLAARLPERMRVRLRIA